MGRMGRARQTARLLDGVLITAATRGHRPRLQLEDLRAAAHRELPAEAARNSGDSIQSRSMQKMCRPPHMLPPLYEEPQQAADNAVVEVFVRREAKHAQLCGLRFKRRSRRPAGSDRDELANSIML